MSDSEEHKQQIIEALLENAALTDGLGDEDAQDLLDWCAAQVAAFTPTAECTLADYGQQLARQARVMARIATHIEDGDAPDRIQRRLRQLTNDPDEQERFLRLLDPPRSTQDYLQVMYRMVANSSSLQKNEVTEKGSRDV